MPASRRRFRKKLLRDHPIQWRFLSSHSNGSSAISAKPSARVASLSSRAKKDTKLSNSWMPCTALAAPAKKSRWASARLREPYNSFGNGAAMRVSPVGFAFETMEDVLAWSKRSAEVTHNHPEGIRAAQATAAAIYLARRTQNKDEIRRALESQF